jgi:CO/xanthine dehydrogenase FAD-binding subunit
LLKASSGKNSNLDFLEDIAMEALKECDPGSDTHNTAQYKKTWQEHY